MPAATTSGIMLTGLSLAVVSYPLQSIVPAIGSAAAIAASALLILGVVLSLLRASRSKAPPTWRGRSLESERRDGDGFNLLRRWQRWRARRRFRNLN
jgi:hypothetical protein